MLSFFIKNQCVCYLNDSYVQSKEWTESAALTCFLFSKFSLISILLLKFYNFRILKFVRF